MKFLLLLTFFLLLSCGDHEEYTCAKQENCKICNEVSHSDFKMIFSQNNKLIKCNFKESDSLEIVWLIDPGDGRIKHIEMITESGNIFEWVYSSNGDLTEEIWTNLASEKKYSLRYFERKKELSCYYLIPKLNNWLKTYFIDLSLKNDTLDNYFFYKIEGNSYQLHYNFPDLNSDNLVIEYSFLDNGSVDFTEGEDGHYYPLKKASYSVNSPVIEGYDKRPIIGITKISDKTSSSPVKINHILFDGDLIHEWDEFYMLMDKYGKMNLKQKLKELVLRNGFDLVNGKLVTCKSLVDELRRVSN